MVIRGKTGRGRRRLGLRGREICAAYVGMTPFILGFIVFTAGPILYSLYLSFTRYPILDPPRWVGLANYVKMFTDDELFGVSLGITLRYTAVVVPAGVVVSYILALILNQDVRGISVWRTAFYIPSVVPGMATAFLFSWLLQADFGLVNQLLRRVGIAGPNWWGDRQVVIWTFIIMGLWATGGSVVLYLAALQGVPTPLYDSAKVDGANGLQRFWHVTVPMTSPVIFFTMVTGMIGSIQIFTPAFVSTGGGPGNASLFYLLYLFRNGWEYLKMGYASAMAWVLFVILVTLTLVSVRVSRHAVYYETEGRG